MILFLTSVAVNAVRLNMGIFSTRIPASLRSLPVRGSIENPFTAGERITMIRLALKETKIDANRYTVLPLPDAEFHKVWVSHLLSQTPCFDLVFTNEPLTGRLLKEAGMRVEKIPMFNRTAFTATEVRKRILEGKNWEELLPKSVAAYIKQIKGEERMREIAQTDKN